MKSWAFFILGTLAIGCVCEFARNVLIALADLLSAVRALREEVGFLRGDVIRSADEIKGAFEFTSRKSADKCDARELLGCGDKDYPHRSWPFS